MDADRAAGEEQRSVPPPGDGPPPDDGAGSHEELGPLAVERHVKDDGRALILYSRREGT